MKREHLSLSIVEIGDETSAGCRADASRESVDRLLGVRPVYHSLKFTCVRGLMDV